MTLNNFNVIPFDDFDGSEQWKVESLQLVNWGGFNGYHKIDFSDSATLLTGSSGSGKSTILDAWTALLMPSRSTFNNASNDAASGRSRGPEQRNLLTYVRGKKDSYTDDNGVLHDDVLRGQNGPTWSAVAATFVNRHSQFTALRVFLAPKDATRNGDVITKIMTCNRRFDLHDFDTKGHANNGFKKPALKRDFPFLTHYDNNYRQFSTALSTALSIGVSGDGTNALNLLSRIQAGYRVTSVNDLFQTIVFDEPETFDAAEMACNSWGPIEQMHTRMKEKEKKHNLLSPITQYYTEWENANSKQNVIDKFGIAGDTPGPFALWCVKTEHEMVNQETEKNRAEHAAATKKQDEAAAEKMRLNALIKDNYNAQQESGGQEISSLQAQILHAEEETRSAEQRRALFNETTRILGTINNSAEFETLQNEAQQFESEYENNNKRIAAEQSEATAQKYKITETLTELRAEHDSLSKRDGLMRRDLHEARTLVAKTLNVPTDSLPFVGELIDVQEGNEPWRDAIETVLYPFATVMLVDEKILPGLSKKIDALKIGVRLRFEGVPTSDAHTVTTTEPANTIAGKLVYKESPFTKWVYQQIVDRYNHDCVDNPTQLDGKSRQVTIAGQTRDKKKGAHGRGYRQNILGFSNKQRLQSLSEHISETVEHLAATENRISDTTAERTLLTTKSAAYRSVASTLWNDIDVHQKQARLTALQDRLDALLEGNSVLPRLQQEEKDLEQQRERVYHEEGVLQNRIAQLDEEYAKMCDIQDTLTDTEDRLEHDHGVVCDDEQFTELNTLAEQLRTNFALNSFESLKSTMLDTLQQDRNKADNESRVAAERLETVFKRYRDLFPEETRNLGTSVTSYHDYKTILDEIEHEGLHTVREIWEKHMAEFNATTLMMLNAAIVEASRKLARRLNPINATLQNLPFGANNDRLQIVLHHRNQTEVSTFLKELRDLGSGIAEDRTDDNYETRFERIRTLIGKIREPEDGSTAGAAERRRLLDVREHIEITAVRVDTETGNHLSVYTHLGGKSGGETQELVAFIIGSALRYQLGDKENDHPTFAPVFMDEGFIKSDSEFAGRAIQAWKALGFQLVIAAPINMYNAIAPHVHREYSTVKNPQGESQAILTQETTQEHNGNPKNNTQTPLTKTKQPS